MGAGKIVAGFAIATLVAFSAKAEALLQDKTTGKPLALPDGTFLTSTNALVARTEKTLEEQGRRTKSLGEVFTPRFICERMTAFIEDDWRESHETTQPSNHQTTKPSNHQTTKPSTWQAWVDARVLEITCGEAPFIVSRYDAATGEGIPFAERYGILDRKLRTVAENTTRLADYLKWAKRAVESCYGFEYSADSLLLARRNVALAWAEAFEAKFHRKPRREESADIANTIAWNFWQMDGLTGTVKNHEHDLLGSSASDVPCRIYDWRKRIPILYNDIQKGDTMKFDYAIGNPPYQDTTVGTCTAAKPIYHIFMDKAYEVSDKVELITPGRFLFNAGATPKAWNKKMLDDPHFKILYYKQKSDEIFANTDIKGGVAISYHDLTKDFGAIGTFTAYAELNSIMRKVVSSIGDNLSGLVSNRGMYRFSPKAYAEQPEEMKKTSDPRISTDAFEEMPLLFTEEKPDDGQEYFQIFGNYKRQRVYRWFRRDYCVPIPNLMQYKIILPKANGSGTLGETLSSPIVGEPMIGFTETFIAIGRFENREEAENCMKYIKTKFVRAMLGVLKITQDNPPSVWRYVPMQDFTAGSDIDWTKEIEEIDQALYKKYGLDDKEIKFIESKVREMQ